MEQGSVLTFEQLPKAVSQLFTEVEDIKQLLLLLSEKNKPETDRWFNIDELISYLPEKPAKATVYTWASNNTIPTHKKAKKLFFLKSEIDAWLKSGCRKTIAKTEQIPGK